MLTGAGISWHLWASVSNCKMDRDDSSCLRAVAASGRDGVDYVWLSLELLCVVTPGRGLLEASMGREAGVLQGILQFSEQPPSQRVIWPQMSAVQRVRKCHSRGLVQDTANPCDVLSPGYMHSRCLVEKWYSPHSFKALSFSSCFGFASWTLSCMAMVTGTTEAHMLVIL